MTDLYILALENNKYYVGKTKNPNYRITQHFENNGSDFTKLYKPLTIINIIHDIDDFMEDRYVEMLMNIYGINNVRGGVYSQIELPRYMIKTLEKKFIHNADSCFNCGSDDHFVKECIIKPNAWIAQCTVKEIDEKLNEIKQLEELYCFVEKLRKLNLHKLVDDIQKYYILIGKNINPFTRNNDNFIITCSNCYDHLKEIEKLYVKEQNNLFILGYDLCEGGLYNTFPITKETLFELETYIYELLNQLATKEIQLFNNNEKLKIKNKQELLTIKNKLLINKLKNL